MIFGAESLVRVVYYVIAILKYKHHTCVGQQYGMPGRDPPWCCTPPLCLLYGCTKIIYMRRTEIRGWGSYILPEMEGRRGFRQVKLRGHQSCITTSAQRTTSIFECLSFPLKWRIVSLPKKRDLVFGTQIATPQKQALLVVHAPI